MWNFLVNTTRTSNLSVIVTTHYIAEAQRADRVGLMRHGSLLEEDSPSNIMARHRVNSLEDAFLEMCIKQNSSPQTPEILQPMTCESNEKDSMASSCKSGSNKSLRWQIVRELMKKQYRKFRRQPL